MKRVCVSPELFPKIAAGDKQAFEELYTITYKPLFALLLSWTKNAEDAKDLLQETYIKIFRSCHLYKDQGNPMGWIIKISRNLFLMKVRKEANNPTYNTFEIQDYDLPLEQISDVENRILIEQLFKTISEEERNIVIMHAIMGLKHREIAEELGMSVGTVLSKYNRTLKKLNSAATEYQNNSEKEGKHE